MDSKSRLLVLVVAATAGCLPRGNPPAGRQLIADSAASLGVMVPPNGDGVLRVVFTRPSVQDSTGLDAFVVSVDTDGEQSPERLLISNIDPEVNFGCTWKIAPCSSDGKGRVFVYRNIPPDTVQPGQALPPLWVDPITGDTEEENWNGYKSPSGQRTFVLDYPAQTTGTLYEADGRTTAIQLAAADPLSFGSSYPQFVGEDFYYVNPQSDLIDIPASGAPQLIATDITDFRGWPTPDGALLELTRQTTDPNGQPLSIRDPATGQETLLPFNGRGSIDFSPDWQWFVYTEYVPSDGPRYTLFNYHSGVSQVLDFGAAYVETRWRPGRNQLWVSAPGNGSPPTTWVVTPGGSTITVAGANCYGFTEDGTYWFSQLDLYSSTPAIKVGVADDPTHPLVPFNPPGTSQQDRTTVLPDGRLLASFYAKDQQRADVIAVDPRTGAQQLLAERGRIAARGQTQFIGMFHFQGGRGDLTAVQLATGKSTVLAPEFTVTAFAEPRGDDLVAPGTRVIYQYQARTPSPYDGIWLVNAP